MRTIEKVFWGVVVLTVLVAAALAVLTYEGGKDRDDYSSAAVTELREVSFRQGFITSPLWIPYVVAQEKGFYREEGLDVSILPGEGSSSTIKLIDTGEDDFGVVFASSAILAKSQGADIVSLAALQQQNNMRVYYRLDSGIQSPADMEGKSLLSAEGGASTNDFNVFAKTTGIDVGSIQWRFVRSTMQVIGMFLDGDIDSLIGRDYQHGLKLSKSIPGEYGEFNPMDYGVEMLGQLLIASDDLVREDPELVRGFVRSTIRGWEYALANHEESVRLMVERYPEMKFEEEIEKWKIISASDIRPPQGFGYQSPDVWTAMNEDYYAVGALERRIDTDEIFTNEFLP